jgi:hypothetical protein
MDGVASIFVAAGIMAQDYVHILLRVQAALVFAIWGIPVS